MPGQGKGEVLSLHVELGDLLHQLEDILGRVVTDVSKQELVVVVTPVNPAEPILFTGSDTGNMGTSPSRLVSWLVHALLQRGATNDKIEEAFLAAMRTQPTDMAARLVAPKPKSGYLPGGCGLANNNRRFETSFDPLGSDDAETNGACSVGATTSVE
jgi:hypothetical protein